MMNDAIRIALINKEIETYRKFAVALESLKTVVHSFDGKCFNKKFTEAMDNFLKYGKTERIFCVNAGMNTTASYGKFFDINIHCYDDYIRGEPDKNGYCGSYYITNSDCNLRMSAEETTTITEGGKYRINAKGIVEKFDEKIQYLNDKAVELEKSIKVIDSMKADMEHIKHLIAVFDGKYQGRIKEVFNCNYRLKDNNGMQYR